MFNLLCSSTNQQLFKKIKVATMKIMDDLMEAITCLPQNQHFVVNKDEWYTKEGRGKSMKNALYVQWHGKSLNPPTRVPKY